MGTMNQLAPNILIYLVKLYLWEVRKRIIMLALPPREHLHVPSRILYFILMQY